MKIKQAKEYFEDGVITGFDAVRDPLMPGAWLLVVIGSKTSGKSWTLETALGKQKSYANLDTLIGEIETIAGRVSSLHINV